MMPRKNGFEVAGMAAKQPFDDLIVVVLSDQSKRMTSIGRWCSGLIITIPKTVIHNGGMSSSNCWKNI